MSTTASLADAEGALMTQWFIFHDGNLEPAVEPSWMAVDADYDKATSAAGFHSVEECGGDGSFAVQVYGKGDEPHWLFTFGPFLVHTVEVRGFADYLEFLAKVAPIATAGLLADLSYTVERAIEKSMPAPHRPRRPLTEAAR